MNPQLFHEPFFRVTLPLMGTIMLATCAMVSINNRRLDDVRDSIKDLRDSLNKRLDVIEDLLRQHGEPSHG
jgi:hypothetical protein